MLEVESISLVCSWLSSKGWIAKGTQSENPYSYYDIVAEKDDKKIYIEVKRRFKNFGDSIIERYKYNKFLEAITTKEIDAGFVISVFPDNNFFSISNILRPIEETKKIANRTTDFSDSRKVVKDFVHFKQEVIVNL